MFYNKKNNYNFIQNKVFYNYNKKKNDDVFVKFIQINDANYKVKKKTQYFGNLSNINKLNIVKKNIEQNKKASKTIINNDNNKLNIYKNIKQNNNITANNIKSTNIYKDIEHNSNFDTNKEIKIEKNIPLNVFGVFFEQKFHYSYYGLQIIKKISSCYVYDVNYKNLTALIYFKIKKDGSVYDIEIKKSSGNSEYDKNVFNTIMRASPFSYLPTNYNSDFLGVFFEFKED
jgi:TonB family protein